MKFGLLPHILPELARAIRGTTDSEWVYALVLSQLEDPYADHSAPDIAAAVTSALRILRAVRRELGIDTFSPMNLFLCDGNDLVAACFTFDHGHYDGLGDDYHPPDEKALRIWYTTGHTYGYYDGEWRMLDAGKESTSCIVASEPLTRDRSTWSMVPMQHLIYIRRSSGVSAVELVSLEDV
jgi:glutamine amidotransferase